MIDGNQLILNQATIAKAVEYWLNKDILKTDVEVDNVSYNAAGTFENGTFTVKLA